LSYFDTASLPRFPNPLRWFWCWLPAEFGLLPGVLVGPVSIARKSSPTPYRVFGDHVSRKRTNLFGAPISWRAWEANFAVKNPASHHQNRFKNRVSFS